MGKHGKYTMLTDGNEKIVLKRQEGEYSISEAYELLLELQQRIIKSHRG